MAELRSAPGWSAADQHTGSTTVHIIDTPERIRSFLPQPDDLAGQCLIVCATPSTCSPSPEPGTLCSVGRVGGQ